MTKSRMRGVPTVTIHPTRAVPWLYTLRQFMKKFIWEDICVGPGYLQTHQRNEVIDIKIKMLDKSIIS